MPLEEYFNTGDNSFIDSGNQYRFGHSFTAGRIYTLDFVKLKIYRDASLTSGTLNLKESDGAGIPTGSILSSGTISSDLTTNSAGEWYTIEMSNYEVSSGQQYLLYFDTPSPVGGLIYWRRNSTPGQDPGEHYIYSATFGASWAKYTDRDMLYEVWSASSIDYDEGELVVSAAASVTITGESHIYNDGELAVSAAASVTLVGEVYKDASPYPEGRPGDYDPDQTWDEESGTWSATYVSVIQNRTIYFVTIGEQGGIYFNEDSGI